MQRELSDDRLNDYAAKIRTFGKVATLFLLLACAALFIATPAEAQTPSFVFTVETSSTNGQSVVPRLTWTTAPAGASCSVPAPGVDNWSGSQLAAGTALLPGIKATTSYALTCTWAGVATAVVTWVAPTLNTDGTALTDLGGFRMLWGKSSGELDQTAYLQNPGLRTWTSPALAPGPWYFGVIAVKTNGLESVLSNIASKTMTAAATQTRTLEVAVKFPAPATNVAVQ